ncbi:SOS response-associated peptidase [Bosea sp. PAMC 26642]|uniref:SOS response-associated peptidase n=1 Tax=Bosea sp. (strain PAMC 26642) TaxID=1792307 RepID=UPI0007704A56|nr:SOS response-associated peptidase family protein [Bosea sp. PAMC 26642]AMJ63248.1 hypothetical protein AXW83_25720 [Bosea sp. PAMC 26642]
MCNLYSMTKGQQAIRDLARAMRDTTGNLPLLPGIFPDYPAPIVRNALDGVRELAMVRWGMPSSKRAIYDAATKRADKLRAKAKPVDFDELLRMEPDGGTTNVRNTTSSHWKPWLGVANRCIVPLTSFSEFDHAAKQDVWFALGEDRPLAFFAGIWTPQWTGVRKIKNGIETTDLFAFLTTTPNAEVGAIHPKAMPVILTKAEEIETWMSAPWSDAAALQRPLADGALVEVARGVKKDEIAT